MNQYYKLITALLLLLFSTAINAATITAQLDVSPVLISDSFRLIYSAEGSVDDDPDFSPIEKNFTILGKQTSSNISMINGDFKRTKKWIISLAAKNTGKFIIPAIKFGKDLAPEVEINVKNTPVSSANNPSQDFIVELEARNDSAFLQQQIIITARLLVAKNISNYQISALRIDDSDAIVKTIGKDRQYKTYRGSKAFIIVERQFAVFPQHKGILKIQPVVAEVSIPSNNARGGFFDSFNSFTTQKRFQSNKLDIPVRDIPASFKAKNWLPSSSIKLTEDWPQNTIFTAGEPITRTITIVADALTSAQLPELEASTLENLKQYPDKPVLEDKLSGKGISSIRKQKIAYIPTKPGTYILPAIDIPWWNTKTNKIDIAHLSKREFNVIAAATSEPLAALPEPIDSAIQDSSSTSTKNIIHNTTGENFVWRWISLVLLLLWFATLLLLLKLKRSQKNNTIKNDSNAQSLSVSLKYLKISCAANNASDTKSALLNWAAILFPMSPPQNLTSLANLLESPISEKIQSLNTHLYANTHSKWHAENLYELCRNYKNTSSKPNKPTNSAKLEPHNTL